ncbi:hypothetical protein [Infirmifilum uzonense]|nr:hypothetical protein [Infirmifilum uzonense]
MRPGEKPRLRKRLERVLVYAGLEEVNGLRFTRRTAKLARRLLALLARQA